MASQEDVFRAFKTFWEASAELTAAGVAGPYLNNAPDPAAATFPYVVIQPLTGVRTGTTNASQFWKYPLRVKVFAKTGDVAGAKLDAICDVLDEATFTLTVGQQLKFRRMNEGAMSEEKKVEQRWALFEFELTKPRRQPS